MPLPTPLLPALQPTAGRRLSRHPRQRSRAPCRHALSRTHSLAHSTRSTSNFLMGNICVNSDPDAAADKVWKMQAERENLYNWLTSKVGTGNAPLRLEARLRVPLPLDSTRNRLTTDSVLSLSRLIRSRGPSLNTQQGLDNQATVMACRNLGLYTVGDLMVTEPMTLLRLGVNMADTSRLPREAMDYIMVRG